MVLRSAAKLDMGHAESLVGSGRARYTGWVRLDAPRLC